MKQAGDHYLFLGPSKSASPATDPLTHEQKVKYATAMFPGIQLGDSSVRTWVQANAISTKERIYRYNLCCR